jgi:putative two-component system response regulator
MDEQRILQANILIVDDGADSVAIMQNALSRAGYAYVRAVTDSRQAAAAFRESEPDLLILDLVMPAPDGYDILDEVAIRRSAGPRVPVLVVTADTSRITRLKALSMGAKDFLTKPVEPVELSVRVHNLIEIGLLYRDLAEARALAEAY